MAEVKHQFVHERISKFRKFKLKRFREKVRRSFRQIVTPPSFSLYRRGLPFMDDLAVFHNGFDQVNSSVVGHEMNRRVF